MKFRRTLGLTAIAMIAFAANSLLCRAALRRLTIDAASFSSIRIVSGAVALCLILSIRNRHSSLTGSWLSAAALFAYVALFSFAYNTLPAATGALLLFAAVQATMIVWGFCAGERLSSRQWLGFLIASAGLVLLLLPGLSAPSIAGSLLMLSAGFAWGIYSVRGRTSGDATSATAGNFVRAVPVTLLLSVAFLRQAHVDLTGAGYAILSGAITSGLGYIIWYAALPGLTSTTAATVQLSAPVLAAIGGILLLSEPITIRFFISAVAVLGGIALVILEKHQQKC
ncbi:MAG: DMT family transporter [Chthoniobacterales bacterium]